MDIHESCGDFGKAKVKSYSKVSRKLFYDVLNAEQDIQNGNEGKW